MAVGEKISIKDAAYMTDLDCVILETKQTAVWYTTVGY
jgi:hypothetical protein